MDKAQQQIAKAINHHLHKISMMEAATAHNLTVGASEYIIERIESHRAAIRALSAEMKRGDEHE